MSARDPHVIKCKPFLQVTSSLITHENFYHHCYIVYRRENIGNTTRILLLWSTPQDVVEDKTQSLQNVS
jgi:hypothetical protein